MSTFVNTSVDEIIIELKGTDEAQLLLGQIEVGLDNMMIPMMEARAVAMRDMQDHFDKEEDPDGYEWYLLDPDYAKYKESIGGSDKILNLFGAMEKAATSQEAWIVTEHELLFDVTVLPLAADGVNYGILHQLGSEDQGNVGKHADFRERAAFAPVVEGESRGTHVSLGIGRGKALPQRPFIGLSEHAAAEIDGIFDSYFQSVGGGSSVDPLFSTFYNPHGQLQTKSTITGQFGPLV